jgi:hypothetical protein
METAPLKLFATWARTALIREVAARISIVLAPASRERVELTRAVAALEKAVAVAGGGDRGKAAVADRVAYTWFNRMIALRFMDANGYTGSGVVSPQVGVEAGQPEILADAKRANIDVGVVGVKTRETVTSLLNGTRRSDDPQGEAYALLLADHCRYWNRTMPFMFEREGDFTELLIPGNLLTDDSVPSRAVKVLTKDVCQDVEVIGWLYQFYISERKDEVFAGFKKNKKAGAEEIPAATQLFTPHWIVRYLVENSLGRLWMLNRPSSRLVDQMEYYIAPIEEETDFLKIAGPEELKVVDPACGSGHMLTYAFDILFAIYEEEGYSPAEIPGLILTNNLYGVEIDPRAGALAAFALTMKARGKQRTFFGKHVEPNVCVLDTIRFTPTEIDFLLRPGGDRHAETAFWKQFEHADTLGALIQPDPELTARLAEHIVQVDDTGELFDTDVIATARRAVRQAEYLVTRYSVAVANPPYMGGRNMDSRFAEYAQSRFPESKSDLCSMFIERCLQLVRRRGLVGMVTMHVWMFISSFEKLRERLLTEVGFRSMAHLGAGAFDSIGGEVVATTAFVMSVGVNQRCPGTFIRLVAERGELAKASILKRATSRTGDPETKFVRRQEVFRQIPGSPISYWLDSALMRTFAEPSLGRFITTEGQNKTANNDRYLRYHWEVSRSSIGVGERWITYAKGGKYRRWYGNIEYVVDWSDAARSEYRSNTSCRIIAEEFWYRDGVTWNGISPKGTGFRYLPPGGTFDMGGPTAFLSPGVNMDSVIGFLNSGYVQEVLQAINPTINLQLKDVRSLPFPESASHNVTLANLSRECVEISHADWDDLETSLEFRAPALLRLRGECETLRSIFDKVAASQRESVTRLAGLEAEVNSVVNEILRKPASQLASSSTTITLWANPDYRYERELDKDVRETSRLRDCMADTVSYAVGCMLGRYSLDEPGLVLADQSATLHDYLSKVQTPSFAPDSDNVIPIVDGDWFEDDIVVRFRTFLRAAFGEQHFEENLRFVAEALGVRDIRDYFVKSFFKDHIQRYKKRPIYWLFSSPKGSFNALIYIHRYTPSTVSTVLNEYLREYRAKLSSSLQQQERLAVSGGTPRQQAAAQKEADRLRKVLLELEEYEHDVLFPLASRQLTIDLDDGVKANYPKFGAALKKIVGLEASDE